MKKHNLIIFLVIIISNLLCTSYNKKLKPNPYPDTHVLCFVCKGYGVIESYSSKPSINEFYKGKEMDEGSQSCLGLPGDDVRYRKGMIENKINAPGRHTEGSMVKKLVKCPRCEGIGWIKKNAKSDFQNHGIHYYDSILNYDSIIKTNKLLKK